ncbi:MAG: hypothetical protein QM774_11950 [Gordonia sp. (in: high G+C Gram-positive bacteria)]|uniref:hypothetical protein n=1 Tax=Gordonia sp. (in: high G+C Gram-positive bacteria) TaxID=84139 RepID=UPI0039E5D09D
MSSSLEESAKAREEADFAIRGRTPRERRNYAKVLVRARELEGREPEQWVVDVAEGRLPA